MRKKSQSRRGTILLMVVSVLALLFVVIITFITITRSDRATIRDLQKSNTIDSIVQFHKTRAEELVRKEFLGSDSQPLSSKDAQYETIPGYGLGSFIASYPAWSEGVNLGPDVNFAGAGAIAQAWSEFGRVVMGAMTRLNPTADDKPSDIGLVPGSNPPLIRLPLWPMQVWRGIPENELDSNIAFDAADLSHFARNPIGDAMGIGFPNTWIDYQAEGNDFANALAGTPVRIRGAGITLTANPAPGVGAPNVALQTWSRFLASARYATAMSIVSNGGMVTLDSPTIDDGLGRAYDAWNRDFQEHMLDAFRNPNDRSLRTWSAQQRDDLFNRLSYSQGQVEMQLRRRFGLPTATAEYVQYNQLNARTAVPPPLQQLQGELDRTYSLPFTFLPQFYTVNGRIAQPDQSLRVAFSSYKPNPSQMFNVSDASELRGAANAYAPTPAWFLNSGRMNNLNNFNVLPNQRALITTVNYSDDIARKQRSNDPLPISNFAARYRQPLIPGGFGKLEDVAKYPGTTRVYGSTYAGETKFPLTELAKAIERVNVVGSGAGAMARPAGNTVSGSMDFRYVPHRGTPSPTNGAGTVKVGDELIERMARLIYDMLESHSGTNDDWHELIGTDDDANYDGGDPNSSITGEATSRWEQALMYAVNIMAFAMPRDTTSAMRGYCDVVTYKDGATGLEYVGFGPQPFITEAIAHEDDRPGDNLAIAIELYNPNDPGYVGGVPPQDAFALWTPQFGIQIVRNGVESPVQPLGTLGVPAPAFPVQTQFNGRSFGLVVLKNHPLANANDHFDSLLSDPTINALAPILTTDATKNDTIIIRLKKRGWDPDSNTAGTTLGPPYEIRWYTVDQISLKMPDDGPDDEADGDDPRHDWTTFWRDTSPYKLFGGIANPTPGQVGLARWDVVLPPGRNQRTQTDASSLTAGPEINTLRDQRHLTDDGVGVIDPDATTDVFRPAVPLPLMNAGPSGTAPSPTIEALLNNLPMFGNLRNLTGGAAASEGDLRPRSFPTTGFLLFVPRYSHVIDTTGLRTFTASDVMLKAWKRRSGGLGTPGTYPADFGHVPIFDNRQDVVAGSYLQKSGKVPWGQLIFDYFTTQNPATPGYDPLKVPGRININVAPWTVLQHLPLVGPIDNTGNLPLRGDWVTNPAFSTSDPSPAFWSPSVGVLVGVGSLAGVDPDYAGPYQRSLLTDPQRPDPNVGQGGRLPRWDNGLQRWELGPWLADAATAYRDGFQVLPYNPAQISLAEPGMVYADAHLRGGTGKLRRNDGTIDPSVSRAYRPDVYGVPTGADSIRGATVNPIADPNTPDFPTQFGFLTIGELANVKGFDSSRPQQLPPIRPDATDTTLGRGDFFRAASLLALLDSQFLTTRSNTFTAYVSVMDRAQPEASTRAQYTIDRSNLLPRLEYEYAFTPSGGLPLPPLRVRKLDLFNGVTTSPPAGTDGIPETAVRHTAPAGAAPTIVAEHRVGYFNTKFDD